jgi:pyruvate,water dikinase
MVRSMFLQIGSELVKKKLLNNYKDVFYLTIDELFNYNNYDLKELVRDRKNEYYIYNELPNYSRLIFTGSEFDKHHKRVNNVKKEISKNKLLGTPSSSGIVKGYAIVVDDIKKIKNVKDKILITKMTDPGWVFLLATCKGVISEKGSLLSHTAIISRELKVPSIVGVDDVTNIIKNNDYIKMNANTGEIEILERGK